MRSMTRSGRSWVLALCALTAAFGLYQLHRARADLPDTPRLFYAGELEEGGVAVTGTKDIQVTLYDAASGGTEQCKTPDQASVDVVAGRFRVELPPECVTAIRSQGQLFAEVKVGSNVLGTQPLGSVPYALEADHAKSADQVAWSGVTGGPNLQYTGQYVSDSRQAAGGPNFAGSVEYENMTSTSNSICFLTSVQTWQKAYLGNWTACHISPQAGVWRLEAYKACNATGTLCDESYCNARCVSW